MKTIQISDELHSKLTELAKEYVEQDNRATAMPYLFQIRDKEEYPIAEGFGGEPIWVNSDGDELRTEEDIKEFIVQCTYEEIENIYDETEAERLALAEYDAMGTIDVDRFLRDKDYYIVEVAKRSKYTNAFLTARACKEHIKANRHHYNEPVDYLNHSWRNPEMELISEFLQEIHKSS